MLQQEKQTEAVTHDKCEAVLAIEENCKLFAVCHCAVCGKWLCAAHLADELTHACAVEPGDEGGEA